LPTRHSVLLSDEEARLLHGLVGASLDEIVVGADLPPYFWCALRCGETEVEITVDEIPTPTRQHEHADVERPVVVVPGSAIESDILKRDETSREEIADVLEEVREDPVPAPRLEECEHSTHARDLGRISDIVLLTTSVWFTPPEPYDHRAFMRELYETVHGHRPAPDLFAHDQGPSKGVGWDVQWAHPRDSATIEMLEAGDRRGFDSGLVQLDCGIVVRTEAGHEVVLTTPGFVVEIAVDEGIPEDVAAVVDETSLHERFPA
jgi:hypothetical protein